ncbi:sensor histidine kinase [Desulfurivibrio alkaliphilus]|uniref:histidine kinase n=1 Tax=Desulfurivibrio alkaliphilus (strain DSM 19089 / UNIQEM U267 / AHT2) TaxID=589865 RepID=D6Z441_DESAT|nr:sensor histidine kinase [Desulfurivibrio alkaliphilus]ADH86316.1 histidine kinase [Desulfurivibrio alkaliphilus AHT 2]
MTTTRSQQVDPALENLPLPVLLVDREFKLIQLNRAARILGQSGEQDQASTCHGFLRDLLEPCRVPLAECPVRAFYEGGSTYLCCHHCCQGRPVALFDGGYGLAGLLVTDHPAPLLDEQRLLHTGKMAALGSMLAHIVHNLNSTFYVTGNYLGVLRRKLAAKVGDDQEIAQPLQLLGEANRLASDMARTLLDYTRRRDSCRQVEAREAATEVLALLATALDAAGIETRLTGLENGPRLDRQALLTVLFNVTQNAIEAMPEGGRLQIEIGADHITVSDQGRGIAPAELAKVFEPYYTTSETGTGLGLYIARRMMASMGGEIELVSLPGQGTICRLHFAPAGQNDRSTAEKTSKQGGNRTT